MDSLYSAGIEIWNGIPTGYRFATRKLCSVSGSLVFSSSHTVSIPSLIIVVSTLAVFEALKGFTVIRRSLPVMDW